MVIVFTALLLMLGTSAAEPQDLTGKWLTFPQQTDTDHVTLKVKQTELVNLTVCMRVFSDLRGAHGLFLLTTNSSYDSRNNFLLRNAPESSLYQVQYNSTSASFHHKDNYVINAWQSLCCTWDADIGLVQIWIDGKHSSRKFLSNRHMTGPIAVILGQAQRYSSFVKEEAFVGMITDLHVWDHVLRPVLIRNYALHRSYPHGEILDWSHLDFHIYGRILVEGNIRHSTMM